jgi:hypothetical protein
MAELLWKHPDPTSTPMWDFLSRVNEKHGLQLKDYQGLYAWSVDNVGLFWEECWQFVGIQAELNGKVRRSPEAETFHAAATMICMSLITNGMASKDRF